MTVIPYVGGMTVTDQQKLDALNASYLAIVEGMAAAFREGTSSAELLRLRDDLGAEIRDLERKMAASSGRMFRPIVERNV